MGSNSKDVIEKGEEFKMAESVEDDKNEYVQQTDDMDISVINDSKKLEVEKNHVIGKNVINVNEREDVQQTDVAEIFVVDDYMVPEVDKNNDMDIRKEDVIKKEENEDYIDVIDREVGQKTDDAEKSVKLEVEKNDDMEKRTDDVIEREGKENVNDVKLETGSNDEKEIKTDAVVEKEEINDSRDIRTDIIDEKVESTWNNG